MNEDFKHYMQSVIYDPIHLEEMNNGLPQSPYNELLFQMLLEKRWSGFGGKFRKAKDFSRFLAEFIVGGV